MPRKKDKVGPLIEELAIKIANEALADHVISVVENAEGKEVHVERPTTFEDRLDAFAKLTTYQIGITRAKAKDTARGEDEEEAESGTILSFSRKLKEAENGAV